MHFWHKDSQKPSDIWWSIDDIILTSFLFDKELSQLQYDKFLDKSFPNILDVQDIWKHVWNLNGYIHLFSTTKDPSVGFTCLKIEYGKLL